MGGSREGGGGYRGREGRERWEGGVGRGGDGKGVAGKGNGERWARGGKWVREEIGFGWGGGWRRGGGGHGNEESD